MTVIKIQQIATRPTIRVDQTGKPTAYRPSYMVRRLIHQKYDIEYFVSEDGDWRCNLSRRCKNCKGLQACISQPPRFIPRR